MCRRTFVAQVGMLSEIDVELTNFFLLKGSNCCRSFLIFERTRSETARERRETMPRSATADSRLDLHGEPAHVDGDGSKLNIAEF